MQATTVNEGIRLSNVSGDMAAETTNGDIVIENAQTSSLDASTVNGDVTFNGTMRDGGTYRLTTHGGDIRVGLGGAANATVFVRTFQGDFNADFPIQLPEGQSARSGSKRFNFTLGTGSARIELQSFNGDILVARKTILSSEEARRIRRGQSASAAAAASATAAASPGAEAAKATQDGHGVGHDSLRPQFEFDHDFDFDFDDLEFDVPEIEFPEVEFPEIEFPEVEFPEVHFPRAGQRHGVKPLLPPPPPPAPVPPVAPRIPRP